MNRKVRKDWGVKEWVIFAAIMWALIILFLIWIFGDDSSGGGANNRPNGEIKIEGNGKLEMSVDNSNGELNINRPVSTGGYVQGEDDVWTIFVYLCGSDLESDCGLASDDLQEMCDGTKSDSVRFVVQTGGTTEWESDIIFPDKSQRFLVTSEGIEEVYSEPAEGMGNIPTLANFLIWGTDNYASEHMGVVLWNHGGGSVTGVCFDDTTENQDSLTLPELNKAFYPYFVKTGRKFDFIGFDACLMAGIENANIFATYANYMIASEETEPGGGWDYVTIANYLSDNVDADTVELGKVVCDSYLTSCKDAANGNTATISVIDLSKTDEFVKSFNSASKAIFETITDPAEIANVTRGILWADDYGGNNSIEGYTNMVDIGGVLDAYSLYTNEAEEAKTKLNDMVVYSVNSGMHPKACGVSIYYPLQVPDKTDLETYSMVCVNPYYLAFIDRNCKCGSGVLTDVASYEAIELFDANGIWNYGSNNDTHWNYLTGDGPSGESPFIDYAKEPMVANNHFSLTLGQKGNDFVASAGIVVYQYSDDYSSIISLGETRDYTVDWDTGDICDTLDGTWYSLPDGQNLAIYTVDDTEDSIYFSSPIYLNDEKTNLRIRYDHADSSVHIEGVWDGVDENGAASRETDKLKEGDVIVPIYTQTILDSNEESEVTGEKYTVTGNTEITCSRMPAGTYYTEFYIYDVYGDYSVLDGAAFDIDSTGKVVFREQ